MNAVDNKKFSNAMFEIMIGDPTHEDSANYLDSIDSTFIYHNDSKDYSARETLVSYLINSKLDFNNFNFEKSYREYTNYVLNSLNLDKLYSFEKFKNHLMNNGYLD